MPQLRDELPEVEIAELENGSYFLNVHIVTGRKPALPRPGDLLKDGTRQYMTASKYDAMARNDAKLSWKRYCQNTDSVFSANFDMGLISRVNYRA